MADRIFSRDEVCVATQILGPTHAVAEEDFVGKLREMPHNNVCGYLTEPAHLDEAYSALRNLALITGQSSKKRPSLGQEDLFFLLAHPTRSQNASALLRTALDFPELDPAGVTLSFGTRPILGEKRTVIEGSQVSFTTITPNNLDPNSIPLIFFDGSRHKSALYLTALVQIATSDRRKIIAVDLPGMGGSLMPDNGSVGTRELIQATSTLLNDDSIIPKGQTFDILSHSLGTIPAREFYFNRGSLSGNRSVRRIVLVSPVPSQLERSLGYRYYFSTACYEYRYHSSLDKEWLERVTARDPSNIHPISIPHGAYVRPFIERVGREDGIRIIFATEDCFARLDDLDPWRNRRGIYLVPHAEHSFLAGHDIRTEHLAIVRQALNDPLEESKPAFSVNRGYRSMMSADWFFPSLGFSYRPNFTMAGAGLSIVARHGLGAEGRLGFDINGQMDILLGFAKYQGEDSFGGIAAMTPYLGLRWLTLPIRAYGGVSGVSGGGIAPNSKGSFLLDVVGGVELEWEALNLRAQYGHNFWSDDPMFHHGNAFTLNLGVRTFLITGPIRDKEP
jgi:pimeloyl-ACP methyl ester carboxylesterase